MNSLETKRLSLRPFNLDIDVPFHILLMNTEKWKRFVGDRNIKTEAEFRDFYEERMRDLFAKGYRNFVLMLKTTGEKIGTCGVYKRESLELADIGYALLPEFEGNGYIVEAIPKVIEHYFSCFPQEKKISAFTAKEHIASQKILKKAGFQVIDERIVPPYEDINLYFEYLKL